MIRKSMPSGYDPMGGNGFPSGQTRNAFARRSCSNKKIERDDDSKKSHRALVKPSLMAQAHHFLDEDRFLFLVEACEQRPRRIRDVALVHGAIVEKLGFVAHLLDNIVRRVSFCACNSLVEPVGAVMAEITHGAVEVGPMLVL